MKEKNEKSKKWKFHLSKELESTNFDHKIGGS